MESLSNFFFFWMKKRKVLVNVHNTRQYHKYVMLSSYNRQDKLDHLIKGGPNDYNFNHATLFLSIS